MGETKIEHEYDDENEYVARAVSPLERQGPTGYRCPVCGHGIPLQEQLPKPRCRRCGWLLS